MTEKEKSTMTKKECLYLYSCCVAGDFWNEERTMENILTAWDDLLSAFREDGETVPCYKLTKAEIKRLMDM